MNLGKCFFFRTGYRISVKDASKEYRKGSIGGYKKGKRRRQGHGVKERRGEELIHKAPRVDTMPSEEQGVQKYLSN